MNELLTFIITKFRFQIKFWEEDKNPHVHILAQIKSNIGENVQLSSHLPKFLFSKRQGAVICLDKMSIQ